MNLLTQLPLYILEFATTENHNKCEIFMVQYSPKIMHCSDSQELLFASASWQLCVANLQGACAWILQDARTSFAVRNLNHKKLFVVGFSNSNNFFVVKSIPAEMVQRSLQNEGAYFYRAKLNRSFFHSVSRFCFHWKFCSPDDLPSTNSLIMALLCRDAKTQVGFGDFHEEESTLVSIGHLKYSLVVLSNHLCTVL